MCALLFYLSKCRQRYEKAANELRDVFNSVAEVRLGSQLESCKYFAACVKESLRISPPIGSSPWREIGEGGETIDGHFIPEGYTVGTGLYSLHHNAAYFHNPHEFIPERWLNSDESDTTGSNTKKSAFNPFSSGPRSCIGESLAYLELLLTIASLLLVYDFRTPERAYDELRADLGTQKPGRGNSEEFQLIDRIFGLSKGPMLQFRPRDILPKKEEANSAKF
jgi:cytochrome P450